MGVILGSTLLIAATAGAAAPVVAASTATATAGTATAATAGSAVAVSGTVAATQTGTVIASGAVVASGPVAWLLVGAELNATTPIQMTLDCWKPVLHNESVEPSRGKRLVDLMADGRIKIARVADAPLLHGIPTIQLINVWDEEFEIVHSSLDRRTGSSRHQSLKVIRRFRP